MLKKIDEQLFLIGVAHVLPKSATEVEEVITNEQPDVVAVELCPTRYLALTQKWKPPSAFEAMHASPKLFLLGSLLHLLQKKFSHQTGMPAGEEMLIAIEHARKIGARIELIDQDVTHIFQRLINRMGLCEKLRLFGELLIGLLPIGKHVDLERLTEEQIVDYLLEELKRTSPTVHEVLIQERDAHMVSKLVLLLAENVKVVCVVGAGHVPGIFKRLSENISKGWKVNLEYKVNP